MSSKHRISDKSLVNLILLFGFVSFMLGTKALATTNGLAVRLRDADRRRAA